MKSSWMLVAGLLFGGMGVFVKLGAPYFSHVELVFYRSFFGLLLSYGILQGTKIRRRLRVVDAFDVYLGGGVGTGVELGILFKKAVPFDELASELEAVIGEFYRQREVSDNFAQYWRRKLAGQKAGAARAAMPTWRCSACGYEHVSADPPTYCPVWVSWTHVIHHARSPSALLAHKKILAGAVGPFVVAAASRPHRRQPLTQTG